MGNAPDFVRELHEPLSLTARHLAETAAPLGISAVPVAGIPPNTTAADLAKLSAPAVPAATALSKNAAPVALAAAPVANAVPMLAHAAPI